MPHAKKIEHPGPVVQARMKLQSADRTLRTYLMAEARHGYGRGVRKDDGGPCPPAWIRHRRADSTGGHRGGY
jgi:hypothetical protein